MLGVYSLHFSQQKTSLHSSFTLAAFFFFKGDSFWFIAFLLLLQVPEWSSTLFKEKMLVISYLPIELTKHKEHKPRWEQNKERAEISCLDTSRFSLDI